MTGILVASAQTGAAWPKGLAWNVLVLVLALCLSALMLLALFLVRRRWRQARPLSTCIVLSIIAHLLFFGYAYSIKLMFDIGPLPAEEPVRVSLVDWDDVPPIGVDASEATEWESPAPDSLADELAAFSELFPEPPLAEPSEKALAQEPDPSSDAAAPSVELPAIADQRPDEASGLDELRDPPAEMTDMAVEEESVEPAEEEENLAADTVDAAPQEFPPEATSAEAADDVLMAVVTSPESAVATDVVAEPDVERSTQDESVEQVRQASGKPIRFRDGVELRIPEVRRPGDGRDVPLVYRLRFAPNRLELASWLGATRESEAAVEAALAWLAAVQREDGRWDADRFGAGREGRVLGQDRRGAGAEADTGITGLALLAFLAAGHTHFEGPYRRNVQHGLEFLLRSQGGNGSLAGQARLFAQMYCHGMATLAVGEAYALTGDDRLRGGLERAVSYTVACQHPSTGGWRYLAEDRGDTSQLGWQLMALTSAREAGLAVPDSAFRRSAVFLRSVSSGAAGGLAGYRPGERPSPTMTAEALVGRWMVGAVDQRSMNEALGLVERYLPSQGQMNLYYWYYGTLACFHAGGPVWQRWNESLQQQLVHHQVRDGNEAGSWSSKTVWGGYGGRVYSTSLAALCLEVPYRYLPLWSSAESTPPSLGWRPSAVR